VIAIGPMPAEGQKGGARGSTKSSLLTDAINWAIAQNDDEKSQYYRKLDTAKIAAAGMSCGGLQALEVAPDPRITTVMVCNSGILGNPRAGMPACPADKDTGKPPPPTIYFGARKRHRYNNGMDDFRASTRAGLRGNLNVGHGGHLRPPHAAICESGDGCCMALNDDRKPLTCLRAILAV